jgi:hypothetical protein
MGMQNQGFRFLIKHFIETHLFLLKKILIFFFNFTSFYTLDIQRMEEDYLALLCFHRGRNFVELTVSSENFEGNIGLVKDC